MLKQRANMRVVPAAPFGATIRHSTAGRGRECIERQVSGGQSCHSVSGPIEILATASALDTGNQLASVTVSFFPSPGRPRLTNYVIDGLNDNLWSVQRNVVRAPGNESL